MFRLYQGFKFIGNFESISKAKKASKNESGFYILKGDNYQSDWYVTKLETNES